MIVSVNDQCEIALSQITQTVHATGSLFGGRQGGQKQGRENSDDGDDH
jgi:hypothetical protein